MAIIIKSNSTINQAVIPVAYYEYKKAVELDGGYIVDEKYTAETFAFIAKYGISDGVVVSPSFGVRPMDGNMNKLYGLFGKNMDNVYVPLSGTGEFPLVTEDGFNALRYPEIVQSVGASDPFTVSTSYTGCVAVKSPNINAATEGYLLSQGIDADLGRRYSISNEPSGGARLRVQAGAGIRDTIYGATQAGYAGWKVSGMFCASNTLKTIEMGTVSNSASTSYFLPSVYTARLGIEANNSGANTMRPAEAWFSEAWAVPDASEDFAIALNARMTSKYIL